MSLSTSTASRTRRLFAGLALAAAAALPLAACTPTAPDPDPGPAASTQAEGILVEDGWIVSSDEGMTPAFAILSNSASTDAVLVGASTSAAEMVELHEMVVDASGNSTMRKADGNFVVGASASAALEPGGLHLMLMGLTAPLLPGDEVELVLEFEDGSTTSLVAIVKDFAGGNEDYVPDGEDEQTEQP